MKEEDALRVLKALLDREGAEWREECGWIRFRSKHSAALWEISCRSCGEEMLFYSRFPFRCGEVEEARRRCERLNRELVRGALFLTEEGTPIYRCEAELDDVYNAERRIASALRYSAQVIVYCWGRISGI
ncbi:MAG: hypothetical protein J5789_06015 [Oscillospiraceae bacterium]|nr:hypothetical protein [Oscillospiraceae bacterium]